LDINNVQFDIQNKFAMKNNCEEVSGKNKKVVKAKRKTNEKK
jgi:hypothetical protein